MTKEEIILNQLILNMNGPSGLCPLQLKEKLLQLKNSRNKIDTKNIII